MNGIERKKAISETIVNIDEWNEVPREVSGKLIPVSFFDLNGNFISSGFVIVAPEFVNQKGERKKLETKPWRRPPFASRYPRADRGVDLEDLMKKLEDLCGENPPNTPNISISLKIQRRNN